ncbi:3-dehydroquinate synthase [Bacteroidota bacterium]|nr:3-dehydroquinate synthase [Bacteroidota bacterium]
MEIYQGTIKSFFKEFKNIFKEKKIYLIVDENTIEHINYLEENFSVTSTYLKLESGEKNKSFNSVLKIWDFLNRNNVKSSDLLFVLGGGMLTDLAGFAASTYKRGIEFIYLPTTLLAMADASIGGKTGFNYQFFKNNIGTFMLPKAVFLDTTFLETLPKIELDSGMAEVYKHSIIGDVDLWNYLKVKSKGLDLDYIIQSSKNLKLEIVNKDPYEKNIRKKLNFGHTTGHAIESYLLESNTPTLHGFAIAKGMIIESFIAKKENQLSENCFQEIKTVLTNKFKFYINFKIDSEAIIKLMLTDKKNTKNTINFSLPTKIGEVTVNHEIELKKVESYLIEFFQND